MCLCKVNLRSCALLLYDTEPTIRRAAASVLEQQWEVRPLECCSAADFVRLSAAAQLAGPFASNIAAAARDVHPEVRLEAVSRCTES